MKFTHFFFLLLMLCSSSCSPASGQSTTTNKLLLTVNGRSFTATLADNSTAKAFAALLPQTLVMAELNGNEKYCYLNTTLPTSATAIGRIEAGDIMLYGNNCIVIFYQSFATSYSYTRIGRIDDISGLTTALGSGNVSVNFSENTTTGLHGLTLSSTSVDYDLNGRKVTSSAKGIVIRNGKKTVR